MKLKRALRTVSGVGFPNIEPQPQDSAGIVVGGAGFEVKACPVVIDDIP